MTRRARRSWLWTVALLLAGGCAQEESAQDLGSFGGGKADAINIDVDLPEIGPRGSGNDTLRYTFRGSGGFKVSLTQPNATAEAWARLYLTDGDRAMETTESSPEPTLEWTPANDTEEFSYTLTIVNRSSSKVLSAHLRIAPAGGAGKLQYKSFRVLFTNPLCKNYPYGQTVKSVSGETLTQKPKNVYCSTADYSSGNRASSPQYNVLRWIDSLGEGDEIFLAYLSFSNSAAAKALCAAIKRGTKVTFVLDANTDKADMLRQCASEAGKPELAKILIRGHQGGIGYAHNKIVLINPEKPGPGDEDSEHMRLVFSSGNASSGMVLHHENWNFIEVKRGTYFAEAHRCLMASQLSDEACSSKSSFRSFINSCRSKIAAAPESDIAAYFIPVSDDGKAATKALVDSINVAQTISIGAHRFSYTTMVNALKERLSSDYSVQVRLIADDDLYWLMPWDGVDPFNEVGTGEKCGDNDTNEAWNVRTLWRAGGNGERFRVKYLETNHGGHLLHHNKYLIFEGMPNGTDALFFGAANLTGTGFETNFENMYFTTIPHVVEAFKTQYARFWDGKKAEGDDEFYGNPECTGITSQSDCQKATGCSWSGSCQLEPFTVPQATDPLNMPERNTLP